MNNGDRQADPAVLERVYADYARALNVFRAEKSVDEKLARAKAVLGERWVLHPANRVRRREVEYGKPGR